MRRESVTVGKRFLAALSVLLIMLLMAVVACSRTDPVSEETTPTAEGVMEEKTPAPSPSPTNTPPPTNTPEPTPVLAAIEVGEQAVGQDGELTIRNVVTPVDGWLVIHSVQDEEPAEVLGYAPLSAGVNPQVQVEIDPYQITGELVAMVHEDTGSAGEFEFPEADAPLADELGEIANTFTVSIDVPRPSLTVSDQAVGSDGLVVIDQVETLAPAWVVVHAMQADEIGEALGQTPLAAGTAAEVVVPIRWREASQELTAVLHEDVEQPGGFNADTDLPVMDGGAPVTASFGVELPPDVFIYDQPVVDGTLVAERVISPTAGWLVVYEEGEETPGLPGLIVGFTALEAGINERVEVDLGTSSAPSPLYLLIHEDTGDVGEFGFPGNDPVISVGGEPLQAFTVRTTPGNYLITRNQVLDEAGVVTIPLVVADLATWLVVYEDSNGQPGEILGQTWLAPGISRDVTVDIGAVPAGTHLWALLHQDAGMVETFEYPDGLDVPLQRNRNVIRSPITILTTDTDAD